MLCGTLTPRQFAAGVDIKIVQEVLGYATSAFTRDVYTSVVPEIAEAAAVAIAAFVPRRASSELKDHENGVWDRRATPVRNSVCAGGGGGRGSNPPAARRAVHRF